MKIAYNASAVLANNSLFRNDNRLSESLRRLSSGLKINSAKDNPSGLAMGSRMGAQIEGLAVATQNAGDAISVITIADGALAEIHDMLQRINELAVKANNQIINDVDRQMIQDEVHALKTEVTRIAQTTEFNGQKILDGSFDLRGYTYDSAPFTPGAGLGSAVDVKVTGYSDSVKTGVYEFASIFVEYDEFGNIIENTAAFTVPATVTPPQLELPADLYISAADGNVITFTASRGFELKLEIRNENDEDNLTFNNILVDLVGFGAMDMQVGANEGQQLDIRIARLSLENLGISNIDLSTEEGARDALSKMSQAINYVSSARSRMGAYQNRLEHTISNLDITSENMTAAYSRIMDVNMATEMTEYTTLQVLVQASTTMLAQANERPSQVLQLLQ